MGGKIPTKLKLEEPSTLKENLVMKRSRKTVRGVFVIYRTIGVMRAAHPKPGILGMQTKFRKTSNGRRREDRRNKEGRNMDPFTYLKLREDRLGRIETGKWKRNVKSEG